MSEKYVVTWTGFKSTHVLWLNACGPLNNKTGLSRSAAAAWCLAALQACELGIPHVDTVCIASYDHANQRDLNVLKRAEGDGEVFIVVDDFVDTGGTAKAIHEMYPKAHFVTIFAKPAGRPLVDDSSIDIPQNTWIKQPWDMSVVFVPPLASK